MGAVPGNGDVAEEPDGVVIVSDVIVVGGGLAGLAAAVALTSAGAKVTVLERRGFLGGRAYSYEHPALGEQIDSQHVTLGCCTNLIDLCRLTGIDGAIRWYDELTFIEPSGRRSVLKPSGLPAPFHQTLSFLRAPMMSLRDKAGIAAGLAQFMRGVPADDGESLAAWLKKTGQTERAIRHFWEPVVVGALNDTFERCSLKYGAKVFYESFLKTREGGRLGIPTKPLSEFFAPVGTRLEEQGSAVVFRASVDAVERGADGCWQVRCGEQIYAAESVVLATNQRQTAKFLGALQGGAGEEGSEGAAGLTTSPITTIHLWYEGEVCDVDHAVLLDSRIQWIFVKSRIRGWEDKSVTYLELVISASHQELTTEREKILAEALRELEMFFPAVAGARLVKSAVLKEAFATFSVTSGADAIRSGQTTAWPGLYLAGDWTTTEWPSTMEGAVRSGRLAAGAVVGSAGRFVTPDLPAKGLMKLLAR